MGRSRLLLFWTQLKVSFESVAGIITNLWNWVELMNCGLLIVHPALCLFFNATFQKFFLRCNSSSSSSWHNHHHHHHQYHLWHPSFGHRRTEISTNIHHMIISWIPIFSWKWGFLSLPTPNWKVNECLCMCVCFTPEHSLVGVLQSKWSGEAWRTASVALHGPREGDQAFLPVLFHRFRLAASLRISREGPPRARCEKLFFLFVAPAFGTESGHCVSLQYIYCIFVWLMSFQLATFYCFIFWFQNFKIYLT